MAKKSLWPEEFPPSGKEGPKDVLEEQAKELSAATDGKLEARVDVGSIGRSISLDFVVVAPALNHYEYRLFQVLHRVHPQFHATFNFSDEKAVEVKTRQEFESQLARILRSKITGKLVAELLELIGEKEPKPRRKVS